MPTTNRAESYLTKGPFPNQGVDLIAVHPFLPILDDVVIVVIVVAIIKDLPLLLVARVLPLTLLVPAFLFCIIDLEQTQRSRPLEQGEQRRRRRKG